jgi:uncharacterized protein (TIGR03067 family)
MEPFDSGQPRTGSRRGGAAFFLGEISSMKQSSLTAKLLKAKQAADRSTHESQHASPNLGLTSRWKWACVLLFVALTAGTSYAVVYFFVLTRIPHQLVGTWVVMEVKVGGGEKSNEALKGGRMQFHRDGTMILQTNMDGKGYTIKATVEVEDETLRITSVNPNNKNETATDVHTIRTLEGDRLVIEDRKGTMLVMERLRE